MKRPVQGSNSLFRAGLLISVLAGLKAVTVDAAVGQDFEAGFAAPDDPDLNLEFAGCPVMSCPRDWPPAKWRSSATEVTRARMRSSRRLDASRGARGRA